jgi:DNA-binding NarL/FixJ family response regulator
LIRVAVAAQVRLYCEGLAEAIARRSDRFVVVGTASTVEQWRELVSRAEIDVGLVDVSMPGMHAAARAGAPIIGLAVPEDEAAVLECAEAGLAGLVTSDAALEDVVTALAGAARGEGIVTPWVAATLLRRVRTLAAERRDPPHAGRLTLREREVVRLIDEGLSNKQIAHRLSIQVSTVKNHVHSILEKLEVDRRSQAAARMRLDPTN